MGQITRIAGSLVEAEGMEGASMYELVKVGEEKLLGEVIKLERGKASIQVYEETSGLQPGEPAEGTGQRLSVQLGPGLLGSIYDGVQRPLELIKEKTGDFISRGAAPDALDKKKKWKFVPDVKKGEKVGPGDIVGHVKETETIDHRILVPRGVEGEVDSIERGEFKITDTVAVVKDGKKKHKIKPLRTWPVRKPRPAADKLAPNVPLITGQRVMDFLFPLAKGGSAAIPGGFGTGKCLVGGTPVLLSTGKIAKIEDIYEENLKGGKVLACDGGGVEEYLYPQNPPELFSMSNNKLSQRKSSSLYTTWVDTTVTISTRSGRVSETTPHHEYRVLKPDFKIEKTSAGNLEEKDLVLVPRKISLERGNREIDILELEGHGDMYLQGEELSEVLGILRKLKDDIGFKKLSSKLDIPEAALYNYLASRYGMPVSRAKKILEFAGEKIKIRYIKGKTSSRGIRIPEKADEKLGEFLGLVAGDGTIQKTYLGLRNSNPKLIKKFEKLAKDLFGAEPWKKKYTYSVDCRATSSALVWLISRIFGLEPGYKTDVVEIPDLVMESGEDVIGAFLRGIYYADGSVSKNEIYISTVSENMANSLSYGLLRLGISFRIERNKGRGKEKDYFHLVIPGKENILKFLEKTKADSSLEKVSKAYREAEGNKYMRTGLGSIPFTPSLLREMVKDLQVTQEELKERKINYYDYLDSGHIPPHKFTRLVSLFSKKLSSRKEKVKKKWKNTLKRMENIAEMSREIYFDEVKSKEINRGLKKVYDFTVPEVHNFVASFGGIINSNTVAQQTFAKWSDADIIVYVGCGERGNEMAEVLEEFPKLEDPRTGKPLMERTILIANTSNMPVAAREASVYTGITLAEYYRDMGYDVALMADSTSRWAEAMREISSRLEEIPGEEGYPAYLASRLSEFYERSGRVVTLGSGNRKGSVSVIGAVSPPGGDFSEPVTQNTLKIVRVFWALDTTLADRRHFPAIDWLTSYSLYTEQTGDWFQEEVNENWNQSRSKCMSILQKEAELQEIVKLVGPDALPDKDRIVLEVARMIREDFLQQNAFHEVDTYCSLEKQYRILDVILDFYRRAEVSLEEMPVEDIVKLDVVDKIARLKLLPEKKFNKQYKKVKKELKKKLKEA